MRTCPRCGALTADVAAPACPGCGLSEADERVARLRELDSRIGPLVAERDALARELWKPFEYTPYPTGGAAAPAPRSGLSGQQVLLGLGVLVLLSAVAAFLVVVWLTVGLYAQAGIVVILIAAGVGASALAARRRLPAATEAAAVIAVGLTVLGLDAAHHLDLAGLGRMPASWYTEAAAPVAALLFLGFSRLVRRAWTYLPAAGAAGAAFALAGISAAYQLTLSPAERYAHAAPLLLGVLVLALLTRRAAWFWWPLAALVVLLVIVPMQDAPWWALMAVAVVVAALVVGGHRRATLAASWRGALTVGVPALQPLLYGFLVYRYDNGAPLAGAAAGAGLWAASYAVGLRHWRAHAQLASLALVAVHVLVGLTVATCLRDVGPVAWAVAAVAGACLETALARLSVGRVRDAEVVAAIVGAVYGLVAVGASVDDGRHLLISAVFAVLAVAVLGYATAPRRFAFGYLALGLLSVAWWTFVSTGRPLELYTLPAAAALAIAGWLQQRLRPGTPSLLVWQPAITVALGPSLVRALQEGDVLRLAVVTAAAVVLLVLGLTFRLQAPVASGAVALIVIALTRGGPYIGYVPYWVTGSVAGIVLLAIGTAWEASMRTGRRGVSWFRALG